MEYQKDVEKFEDLVFQQKYDFPRFGDKIAACEFPNGYGLSIVTGRGAYCDKDTFEVAIWQGGDLTYKTPLTDDVMSYVSPARITEIIQTVKGWRKGQY